MAHPLLLRDFHSQARYGHAIFTLWVYQPISPCSTISPKDMLEVTSQISWKFYTDIVG